MSLLPGWWTALAEQARLGLEQGSGPFWSARFLGGQPLFGAPESPFSGPTALLAMASPHAWLFFHAAVLVSGMALWLRQSGLGLKAAESGAIAGLFAASMLMHPEAAALIGGWAWLPWAVLLSTSVAAWAAAPFCALLACGASPLAMAFGLAGSYAGCRDKRQWALAWALGAAMSAPALLELARLAPASASVNAPGWPFAFISSPLAAFQGGLLLLLVFAGINGWLRAHPGLLLALAGGVAALGSSLVAPSVAERGAPASAYLSGETRRHLPPDLMPQGRALADGHSFTGASGGLAPRESLLRWRSMSALGLMGEDGLSLANVGWLNGDGKAEGKRWFRPVAAALVNRATPSDGPLADPGTPLFARALRVDMEGLEPALAASWRILKPRALAPDLRELPLEEPEPASWAFLSESFDPAWQVTVTGPSGTRKEPVRRTEMGWMAVQVQPHDRLLRWQYRPSRAWAGLFIAIIGFMGAAFLYQRQQRR